MVNSSRGIILACGFTLLATFAVHAGDVVSLRVGDVADQDISTPVVLDVIDAQATAARKADAESKSPAVFRRHTSVTNTMVVKVAAAFTESRSNFLTSLQVRFHQTTLDEAVIQSAAFGDFLTAFNGRNDKFPITSEIARQWAHGETGLEIQTNLLALLLQTTDRPVRADTLPDGFTLGNAVWLVPVHSAKDTFTVDEVKQRGQLVTVSSVTTLTRLRGLFRRDFPPEEQDFARELATYIHPDCELDTNLTLEVRASAVNQSVVVYHYDAGQVIVRRGQVIDDKIETVLTRLNEISPLSQAQPGDSRQLGMAMPAQTVEIRTRYLWLAAAFAAAAVIVLVAFWRRQAARRAALLPTRQIGNSPQHQLLLPSELAPQLAQLLKSAVVQELAAQRLELLQVQQIAATEVVRLMHRLNELNAPLQERLSAYEKRIRELETELDGQSKENRELLKLKIDLLREQIKTERGNGRINFN